MGQPASHFNIKMGLIIKMGQFRINYKDGPANHFNIYIYIYISETFETLTIFK